jgi:hypothetical protein
MRNRLLMTMVAAVAIVAMGGIGFAAFSSSISYNATVSAGTLTINWYGSPSFADNQSYNTCSASFSATTATVSAGSLVPGDWCLVTEVIKDTGNLPGYFWENSPINVVWNNEPAGCTSPAWFFTDNLVSTGASPGVGGIPTNLASWAYSVIPDGSVSIAANGGTVTFGAYFGMLGTDPSACQGASISFSATIAAEIGSGQAIP